MSLHITCRECGKGQSCEQQIFKCPHCGSEKLHIDISVADEVYLHDQIKMSMEDKVKMAGRKKPLKEIVSGDEQRRDTGEWVDKQRMIDRENDRYVEKVTLKNGEVIHHTDEPLSQHWGHGSAKEKGKP